MGVDGARRVVVNSLGREIGTLDEVPPTGGPRVELTIDSDVQRALEEGFAQVRPRRRGGRARSDERRGARLMRASRPTIRTRLPGASTGRRGPLHDGPAEAAAGPGDPGAVFARLDLQDGRRAGRTRGRDHHAGLHGGLPGPGISRSRVQVLEARRPRPRRPASCDRAVVRRVLLHGRQDGGRRRDQQVGDALGLGIKTGIDLPNELAGLVPSTEWKRAKTGEKWYPGETISVAIGQGQVSVTPVSMAVYMAALANGGRRVTPHLLRPWTTGRAGRWCRRRTRRSRA